jgi:hypothetical protein
MKLNFQYAHHSHSESEDRNIKTSSDALSAFDEFDWSGEVKKASELEKCSPTLSVIIKSDEEYVWVSGYSDNDNPIFVSECFFPGEVSAWFGFSKKQGTVNLSADAFSLKQARKAIEYFISKDHSSLRELYA